MVRWWRRFAAARGPAGSVGFAFACGMTAACSGLACAPQDEASVDAPRGVLVVIIDTLRADHLGAYGYARDTSPRMDLLAQDATLFDYAIAPSPWTLPSLATIMTSLYPSVHGAKTRSKTGEWLVNPDEFEPVSILDDSRTTLAELLADAGYRGAAFVRGSYPSKVFGFGQGFEHFEDNATPGLRFNVENALRWLDTAQPEKFFVYLHTVEVHSPYSVAELPYSPLDLDDHFVERHPDAPLDYFAKAIVEEQRRYRSLDFDPDYTGAIDGSLETLRRLEVEGPPPERDIEHLKALYDRGIAYTDFWIGKFLDGLSERGLYDDTLIVITSDHGDEFYEHGRMQHSHTYFDEMLRVPLIVRAPGEGHGLRVSAQVGLVDVLPTALDVLDIATDLPFQGRSLRPLWSGGTLPPRPVFGEASILPRTVAVRTDDRKYIRFPNGQEALYDLRKDPGETARLRGDGELQSFRRQLRNWRAETKQSRQALRLAEPRQAEFDAETRERLRALGYAKD